MDFRTEFKPLTVQPQEIEGRSFEMIDEEIGEHPFTAGQYPVVQRVIHASADFELGRSLVFHPDAIRSGIEEIRSGKKVVADVQMVQVGISKQRIEKYGASDRAEPRSAFGIESRFLPAANPSTQSRCC